MSFTRSQVNNMDPGVIGTIAGDWDKLGLALEQRFDAYVSRVENTTGGGYWEGMAADAAQARACDDRRVAVRLVDELQAAAQIARGIGTAIADARTNVLDKVAAIEAQQFSVGEQWTVTDLRYGPTMPERETLRNTYVGQLAYLVMALNSVDNDGASTIAGLAGTLIAKFTHPASLSGQQATADGTALGDLADGTGSVPADVLQRLIEAGSLTPGQLAALRTGDPVEISASQMEYLNALQDSFDTMTPEQLERILTTLPAEARTGLANSFQLISNERLRATVEGNADVPVRGGFQLLPQKMQDSLTRTIPTEPHPVLSRDVPVFKLEGVGTNQAIARITGMSDANLRAGSQLDSHVLDVASRYLDVQVRAEGTPDGFLSVDGTLHGDSASVQITEPMFEAIAPDKFVVAAALGDGANGERLIGNILQHDWSDEGVISKLTHTTVDDVAVIPGDRADEKNAELHGNIAESVGRYLADHSSSLLQMSGQDGKVSVGDVNPVLVQNLAEDLSPYFSTFAGSGDILDVDNFETASQLAGMYSVFATDQTAANTATAATFTQIAAMEAAYGAGEDISTSAMTAGMMEGALLQGTYNAGATLGKNDIYNAQYMYAQDQSVWDTAKAVATTAFDMAAESLPGGKAGKYIVDIASPMTRLELQGIVDQGAAADRANNDPYNNAKERVSSPNTVANLLNGLMSSDPSIVHDPALALVERTDTGDGERFTIDDQTELQIVRDYLEARQIHVRDWESSFNNGLRSGTVLPRFEDGPR